MSRRRRAPTHPTSTRLCGVDEAGRGPLAGPVVAAAVILNARRPILGLADSKTLAPEERIRLAVREVTPDGILLEITEGGCTRVEALAIAGAARERSPTDKGWLPKTEAGDN